jgi:hypothetical protein
MPLDRSRYPANWDEISRAVKERAGWRCEFCGIAHGAERLNAKGKPYKEVLTCAHLGVPYPDGRPGNPHDKMDCRPENLCALCSICHLSYDRVEHVKQRHINQFLREAQLYASLLFDLPELVRGVVQGHVRPVLCRATRKGAGRRRSHS